MRRFVVSAAVLALLVCGALPAIAQYNTVPTNCIQTFNSGGDVTVTFAQGATIVVKGGAGCAVAGEQVTITLDTVVLGVLAASSDGSYNSTALGLRIPNGTNAGGHTVSAIPNSRRDAPYRQAVTVTAAGSGGGRGATLPTTGQAIAMWTLWALLALAMGYVLMSATWRYRKESRRVRAAQSTARSNGKASARAPVAFAASALPLQSSGSIFGDDPVQTAPARVARPAQREMQDDDEPIAPLDLGRTLERRQTVSVSAGTIDAPIEGAVAEPVRASIAKSTNRTSELLAKLQGEIEAWSEK